MPGSVAGPTAPSKDIGFKGLLAIFYAPGEVFASLNRKSWKLPVIASVLVALLGSALVIELVGMENLARMQFENNPRLVEQMGQDKVNEAIQQAAHSTPRKVMGYVIAPIATIVVLLIVAGVFTLGNMMTGSDIPYGRTLAITAWAMFATGLVRNIGTGAVLTSVNDFSGFDVQNALPVNLSLFVDRSSKMMYSFASSIDLISFWCIYLIALGLQIAVPKSSLGKHLAMVVGFWLIYVLAKVFLLSSFGM